MAAIYAYSNVLERGDLAGIRTSSEGSGGGGGRQAEERRSPVELQLSEVEEILEHTTAAVPQLESTQPELRQEESGPGTTWASASSDVNETSAADEEEEEGEGGSGSDTMTESQEDVLSTETPPSERRRMSLADGLWACLSPVVTTFWKGGSRDKAGRGARSGEDAFEIAFADIKQLEFVGSGAQGAVFSGEYRGENVAVKKVKDKSYCDEICQLRKLSHKNIIQFR